MVVVCRNSRQAAKAETEFGLRLAATNFFFGGNWWHRTW
jgi:hypothetical protein